MREIKLTQSFLHSPSDAENYAKPFPELCTKLVKSYDNLEVTHTASTEPQTVLFRDPEEIFNEDTVYYERINVAFFHFVPGMLTGLGIFFTFLGLAGGVTLASSGLLPSSGSSLTSDTLSVELLLNSIGNLLDGAGQAFFTSIVGLMTSLIFSSVLHSRERDIQGALENLRKAINSKFEYYSLSRLALNTLNKTASQEAMVRDFKNEWDRTIDTFIEKICEGFQKQTENQTDRLIEALDGLRTTIDTKLNERNEQIAGSVEIIIKQCVEELTKAIREMSKSFDESAAGVSKAVVALEKTTNEMVGTVEAAGTVVGQTFDHAQSECKDLAKQVSAVNQEIEQQVSKIATCLGDTSEKITVVGEKLVSSMHEASGNFSNKVSESGEEFSNQTSSAARQFSEAIDKTGTLFSEHLMEGIRESSDHLSYALNSLCDNSEKLAEALANTTKNQQSLLEDYRAIHHSIDESNQSLIAMLKQFETASLLLNENSEDLVKQWKEVIEHANEADHQTSEKSTAALGEISKALGELSTLHQVFNESARKLHGLMNNGITHLTSALSQLQDSVSKNMGTMDHSLSEALGSMSDALADWTDHQASVSDSLQSNTKNLLEAMNQLNAVVRSADRNGSTPVLSTDHSKADKQ